LIGFVLSDSHLLCTQWVATKKYPVVTNLTYQPFVHPLRSVLAQESDLSSVLATGLRQVVEQFPINGNEVYVVLDEALVYHDVITADTTLSKSDVWQYVRWKLAQQWGGRTDDFSIFLRSLPTDSSVHHVMYTWQNLIRQLKLSITELGAVPVWLGSGATTLLYSRPEETAAYVFDEGHAYQLYYRSKENLVFSKLRLTSESPQFITHIGNERAVEKLSAGEQDLFSGSIYLVDELSKKKQEKWQKWDVQSLVPFEGIELDNVSIPSSIPQRYLNILTILIKGNATINAPNMFESEGWQETIESEPPPLVTVREKPTPEPAPEKKRNTNRNVIAGTVFVLLLVILGYFLVMDKGGEPSVAVTKAPVMIPEDEQETGRPYPAPVMRSMERSTTHLATLQSIFQRVHRDSLIFLEIKDMNLTLTLGSHDSLLAQEIPGDLVSSYQVDIPCCGSEGLSMEYRLTPMQPELLHRWCSPYRLEMTLDSLALANNYRLLETRFIGEYSFLPVIIRFDSFETLTTVLSTLPAEGDNVLIRKLLIQHNPETSEFKAILYVSLLNQVI
jgi:hypothetical protein